MKAPTTDQVRDAIDSGATAEKVAMLDPAAAPLGTDAEAAGAPPTQQELSLAAGTPFLSKHAKRTPKVAAVYPALIFAVALASIAIVFLASSQ